MNKRRREFFPSFCFCWLIIVLVLPAAASAQEDDLPALINAAVSENGELVLFYPDGWQVSSGAEIQLTQNDDTPIEITARIVETGQIEPDALPDWILAERLIPPSAAVSTVSYGGVDGWIAQAAFLYEPGVFSALVVLPVSSDQAALIRIDSPAPDIATDAPLITAILERLVILPEVSTVVDVPLQLNTPQDWQLTESENMIQLASENPAASETATSEDFAAQIFITTPEALLSETPAQQEIRDFTVNGQPARMQLTRDRVTGEGILTFTRAWEVDQILAMRVIGATPQLLVDHLPLLQAIFSSITDES